MKKILIICFGMIFGLKLVISQNNTNINHYSIKVDAEESTTKQKSKKLSNNNLFNNIEFGLMSGITQFYGDIKQFDFRPSYARFFDEIKPSYEISIRKKINPLISLKGSFIIGKFGGIHTEKIGDNYEVYDPYNNFYEGKGEYFVTNFKELDLQLLLNLSNASSFFSNHSLDNFDFFFKTGLGINTFNSLNRNFSGTYIYSYGYEEGIYLQNDNFIKKSFLESPKEIVYLYGISSSYKLNNKIDLNFDITKRKSNTDYWDSHDNNANNDYFNFYAFGISYKILNKELKDWLTPIQELEQNINSTNANIEWLSEDSDNDGVSDAFDKELNTPMGVAVDGSGISLDIDMDNIPDYIDKDPFSSKGAIVDNNGVEFDSDNDGIPDSKDLENNTETGSIVNQYGISVINYKNNNENNTYFPSVYFESGSFYINNSNLKRLATVAMILNNNPDLRLEVIGNADKNGDADYNKELAKKRANSVITYLSKNFKFDVNRFKSSSNGEEKPLSIESILNDLPIKKSLSKINRRVDFRIIE